MWKNKSEIQKYVKKIKNFYVELSFFIVALVISAFIYALSAGEISWMLVAVLTWGIIFFLKASKLGVINRVYYDAVHGLREKLPLIKSSWEDEKIAELTHKFERSKNRLKKRSSRVF